MKLMFDAAASTPPISNVLKRVHKTLEIYGSVHRGCGPRSIETSYDYEQSREIVHKHVKATINHAVIFTANTTDSITKLAFSLKANLGKLNVLTSDVEHSANDLPWRQAGHNIMRFSTSSGLINPEEIEKSLKQHPDIDFVSISGASNITGQIVDLATIYKICKKYAKFLFVDCSQRMAHAPCIIGEHCDALAFSGHKIHAPFGAGALVAPKNWMLKNPISLGGGSVITTDQESWVEKGVPHNWESGTPNAVGAVAIAAALQDINYDLISIHDRNIENWYKQYVIPVVGQHNVLWCNGATLMLRLNTIIIKELSKHGVEFRWGEFCCYEAFRSIGALGGIRLSASSFTSENDVKEIGRILSLKN